MGMMRIDYKVVEEIKKIVGKEKLIWWELLILVGRKISKINKD